MNIVAGQKFRVKERSELLLNPDAHVNTQINTGSIILWASTGVFDNNHEMYSNKILTMRGATGRGEWGDGKPSFFAEETGFMYWYPWMVELIDGADSVDENLFLSCLLL